MTDQTTSIELALSAFIEEYGEELIRKIRPVLYTNQDRGRIASFTGADSQRLFEYVRRVAVLYANLNAYFYQLQIERSTTAWEPLFNKLEQWAYHYFLRKNFYADQHTREIASECATEAALNILNAHFPYDVEFEPWAYVIVQFACRKYVYRAMKKSALPPDALVNLDEALENAQDPAPQEQALRQDLQNELQEALARLSEARRRVIELVYFEGLPREQVAKIMGKSVGAIYSLQFHALADLRKIFDNNGDIVND